MFTRKTAILLTVALAAITNLTLAHAHSSTEMGPLLSVVHHWLHASGSEILAVGIAVLAGVWLVGRQKRANRRKGN